MGQHLVEIGFLSVTRGVHEIALQSVTFHQWVMSCVFRHSKCDWGDTCNEDSKNNEIAIGTGGRLFSVFRKPSELDISEDKIWIITEAISLETGQREMTTVLFPSEY